MSEQRLELIEQRLTILESVSRAMEARIKKLEPTPVNPPPIYHAPPIQYVPPKYDLPTPPLATNPAPVANNDGEYQIGAQWLPRIGAGLLVLGIAYLIGLAVTRGWITPPMLFAGAILLCLSFIGLGQWLRDTKEEFGQILTGVGSCGMFLTLAGGHVYQNLYSGETMVAGFVVWSLVNLVYAFWQNSRSFLAIGVVGGFLASVMPLSKDAYVLSLTLHAAILLVAASIIAKQKIEHASIALWISSGCALVPLLVQLDFLWSARVAAVYASTFICLVTYLQSRRSAKSDEDRFVVGFFILAATSIGFGLKWGVEGTYHVLMAAFVCGAMALVYRKDEPVKNAFLFCGLSLATVLAPYGLDPHIAVYVHASLAIIAGVMAAAARQSLGNTFSCILLVCAGISLGMIVEKHGVSFDGQIQMLFMILAAAIALAVGIGKNEDDPRLVVSWFAAWIVISRLATLVAVPTDFKLANFGVTASWVILGCALLVTGFVTNLKNYRYAALTTLLVAVGKVLLVDMATSTPELRVAVLLGVGVALLAGGYAYIRKRQAKI